MRVPINRDGAESGFTLIELVFVLTIAIILSAVIIPVGSKWIRTTAEDDAFKSIIITIQSLQSYSMANNAYTRLRFSKTGTKTMYVAEAPGKIEFSRKLLPEGMHLSGFSNLISVEFSGNGDIISFGRLTLLTNRGSKTIVFQMQRGRMTISESKRIFLAGSNPDPHYYNDRIWYITTVRDKNDDNVALQKNIYVRC
ncbi:type II secretion system protein [Sporosarcina sp. Marseille-Q4063]|uniref:type II secretion system protein n=1 Tax=Sporosarcina sp. Marseille-Q4063 TaxID=2810514 RepID=UPI001BB0D4F2|nr:type II secretion system protein [Sporosarcina sp. Marseille-Q4063]QUW22259.1 type II secretion system protein [Sporosarcina sp. Marseille-Q4063]